MNVKAIILAPTERPRQRLKSKPSPRGTNAAQCHSCGMAGEEGPGFQESKEGTAAVPLKAGEPLRRSKGLARTWRSRGPGTPCGQWLRGRCLGLPETPRLFPSTSDMASWN